MEKSAFIEPDGNYRYWLSRQWNKKKTQLLIIGLNPSTADAEEDDNTISRLISFVRKAGYGGFFICNVFAYRTKDPNKMMEWYRELPVDVEMNEHKKNLQIIWNIRRECEHILFCWGAHKMSGEGRDLIAGLIKAYPTALCFGHTKNGHPKHPLYLDGETQMIPFISQNPGK